MTGTRQDLKARAFEFAASVLQRHKRLSAGWSGSCTHDAAALRGGLERWRDADDVGSKAAESARLKFRRRQWATLILVEPIGRILAKQTQRQPESDSESRGKEPQPKDRECQQLKAPASCVKVARGRHSGVRIEICAGDGDHHPTNNDQSDGLPSSHTESTASPARGKTIGPAFL